METATQISNKLVECFNRGNKCLVMGNGGSASECSHLVSEFVTHGLPAISLCEPATITAIANDYGYSWVFAKQLIVLGKEGDVLIGLSTSGKSKNINLAYKVSKAMKLEVLDWPRKGKDTAEIQENQLKLMHQVYKKLCESQ